MCLAIPIQITEILPDDMAKGEQQGVEVTFSTRLIENPAPGDYCIVHVGIAIEKLDREEADATLRTWEEYRADQLSS